MRRSVVLGIGAVAVAAVAVAAVVVLRGDEPAAPASPPPAAKPAPPLGLAAEPVWTRPADQYFGLQVRDGAMVTFRSDQLALTDVATGTDRWALEGARLQDDGIVSLRSPGGPMPVDAGVLVTYEVYGGSGGNEQGVALLSAVDGHTLWRAPTWTGASQDRPVTILWAADAHTAMVNSYTSDGTAGVNLDQVRAVALDLATGAKRWEHTGFWPYAIAGDTVLGEVSQDSIVNRGEFGNQPFGRVTAVDLATGKDRWDFSGRYAGSKLMAVAGDVAVVRVVEKKRQRDLLVAAGTGRTLDEFDGSERIHSCGSDGKLLIACHMNNSDRRVDRLMIVRADDRSATMSARDVGTFFDVDAVWQDRVFAHSGTEPRFTLDHAGNRVDRDLPGTLLGISGGHAVFAIEDDGEIALSAYAITT